MKLVFVLVSLFAYSTNQSLSSTKTNIWLLESSSSWSERYYENIHHYQNIGRWKYTGSDFPRSTFEIKIENSQYVCIVTFLDDKSSSTEQLTKIGTNRFKVNKSKTGEYYKINRKNGQLEMWDQDGLFIIASKR